MNFSKLIKTKRKESNLTQESLAIKIGTSKQTIANWESDRSKPQITDIEIITAIANELKISKTDIIEAITGLNSINEKEEIIINYPFLPNELMNIKLTKEEIELLFAIEYFKQYKDIVFSDEDDGDFTTNELKYTDYVEILGSGRNVLARKKKISKILDLIQIETLTSIIRKNKLITFDIQQLSEEDIYTIMSVYKESFSYLLNNTEELCYIKPSETTNYRIERPELVIKNKLYESYDNKFNIDNKYILKQPYIKNNFDNYFVSAQLVPEKDTLEYNAKLEIYNEELKSWERKMVEIKKLQDLYDSEKYPDIPKPKEPKRPKKKVCHQLNYKGILLKKFFEKMDKTTNEPSDFVKDARIELEPYLDKTVSLFGTLVLEENNSYLFKSLYIDGNTIDHLWVYNINEPLSIGTTYELKGIVDIYTKDVDGKTMKNYGIKVSEIKIIE